MSDSGRTLGDFPTTVPQDNDTPARGRPRGSTTRRAKRNYVKELAELQTRVDMSLRILRVTADPIPMERVRMAIEILQG